MKSEKKRTCMNCRFYQKMGARRCCEFASMTGQSRVRLGLADQKNPVVRVCDGWQPRNKAEQRKINEMRRRGRMCAIITAEENEPGRTARELGKKRAWEELREQNRGDMARSLGMSARAEEALYGRKRDE